MTLVIVAVTSLSKSDCAFNRAINARNGKPFMCYIFFLKSYTLGMWQWDVTTGLADSD